jgi:hypothetical protein
MWNNRTVDTQQAQEHADTTKYRTVICDHDNLVLTKAILLSKEQKVTWDSKTRICEPDRHTNEPGVDDTDDDDTDSDVSNACQDHDRLSDQYSSQ